jgi:hypothetical protein
MKVPQYLDLSRPVGCDPIDNDPVATPQIKKGPSVFGLPLEAFEVIAGATGEVEHLGNRVF